MLWAILSGLAIAALACLFVLGARPVRHKVTLDGLPRLLDTLLETMADGSVLILRHDGSDAFIQFVKLDTPGGPVIGFGFPDAAWSAAYFGCIEGAFRRHGIEYSITSTGDVAVPRFLEVEMATDPVSEGLRVAELALEAMSIDRDARFTGTLEGDLDARRVISRAFGS